MKLYKNIPKARVKTNSKYSLIFYKDILNNMNFSKNKLNVLVKYDI